MTETGVLEVSKTVLFSQFPKLFKFEIFHKNHFLKDALELFERYFGNNHLNNF
jgi:hypothetical protein